MFLAGERVGVDVDMAGTDNITVVSAFLGRRRASQREVYKCTDERISFSFVGMHLAFFQAWYHM